MALRWPVLLYCTGLFAWMALACMAVLSVLMAVWHLGGLYWCMSLVKCSPWFGGNHGLSLEFWRTLQKWAKLCFFLLALVHGTIMIQKKSGTSGSFYSRGLFVMWPLPVIMSNTGEIHTWFSFLAWQFKVIFKLKSLNLTPHFIFQFCLSSIFCFAHRSCLRT